MILLRATLILLGSFMMSDAEKSKTPEFVRTPEERFENLPGYPFKPNYVDISGLRMHYVDEGKGDVILCLHGEPSWSYLYRKMIPILAKKHRVIAPDLIGFGKSDKLKNRGDYTYKFHFDTIQQLIEKLDLHEVTLVCQDWGGVLGLPVAMQNDARFSKLVIMNTGLPTADRPMSPAFLAWRKFAADHPDMEVGRVVAGGCAREVTDEIRKAYDAPFPDVTYKMGAAQFPLLVPITPEDPAVGYTKPALEKLKSWEKPALVMFSDRDPITAGGDKFLRKWIPSAKNEPTITIEKAGHFLQEDAGEEIAGHINSFLDRHAKSP